MLKMLNRKTLFAALPLLMFCTLWVLAAEKQRNICHQLRTLYSSEIYYSDRPTEQRPILTSWLSEDYLRKVHGIGFPAEPDRKAIELASQLNLKRIYFVVEPNTRAKACIRELLPKVQIAYAIGLDGLRPQAIFDRDSLLQL